MRSCWIGFFSSLGAAPNQTPTRSCPKSILAVRLPSAMIACRRLASSGERGVVAVPATVTIFFLSCLKVSPLDAWSIDSAAVTSAAGPVICSCRCTTGGTAAATAALPASCCSCSSGWAAPQARCARRTAAALTRAPRRTATVCTLQACHPPAVPASR